MKIYRTKPEYINAVQWNGQEVHDCEINNDQEYGEVLVNGNRFAIIGDYIIFDKYNNVSRFLSKRGFESIYEIDEQN